MAAAKISSDMIRPFTGEGDVVAWLKKVNLVAKLAKITELADFIPLYLEGSALALYLELSTTAQQDAAAIEKRLKEAYSDDPFVAHAKLGKQTWTGESVDVYANEIRRLAGLAGYTGENLERSIKLQFVNGFPDAIGIELKQVKNVMDLGMDELLTRARVLAANRGNTTTVSAVAYKVKSNNPQQSNGARPEREARGGEGLGFRGKCFNCSGSHMVRNCPDKKITCYKCGKEGHISRNCDQGNE